MKDKIELLKKYIIYILIGIAICLVGVTGVFADTIIDTSNFINVTGIKYSVSGLSYTSNPTYNNDWLLNNYQVTSGSFIGTDWNYVEFSYFEHNGSSFNPCNSSSMFTANFSLLFTSPGIVDQVTQVKWGNDNCAMTTRNSQTGLISLSCATNPNSSSQTDIFVYYSDSIFQQNQSYVYISRNIQITCGLNTDSIINNNNANTQNIINNNTQNTQDIINNNDENTQKIIDSNKVCNTYDKSSILEQGLLNTSGAISSSGVNYGVTDYISISKNTKIKALDVTSQNLIIVFYNTNKSFLSYIDIANVSLNQELTIPTGAEYVRFTINKVLNKPQFEICDNGSSAVNNTNKGILSKIKELFNFFNNKDDADVSGLNNMAGWLPPGPLDSIINLPLTFFDSLTNVLAGTCRSVQLTLPFVNSSFTLPCFSSYMSQYVTGFSTIWTFIGTTVSVFILYNYLLALYKWIDDTLTLRENNLPGYYDDNWGGGA